MSRWPKAVLFDFDGVIVHSEPLHCRAFQEVLAREGIALGEDEYYRELIGFDDEGCLRHLFAYRGLPLDESRLKKLAQDKQQRMADLIHSGQFHALPGVENFISRLAANDVPVAICSGAIRQEIEPMLKAVGLSSHFPIIVAAADVDVGKPDPRGYRLAAKLLSQKIGRPLEPADCLIVEDAPSVIRSVRAAGFKVLGVAGSYPLSKLGEATWAVKSLEPDQIAAIDALAWLGERG
jgi:HAD superfamily hydrolase (TIGR01509 family)